VVSRLVVDGKSSLATWLGLCGEKKKRRSPVAELLQRMRHAAPSVTLKYTSKYGLWRKALVCCLPSFSQLVPTAVLPTVDGAY
jgi:hypothetical protein